MIAPLLQPPLANPSRAAAQAPRHETLQELHRMLTCGIIARAQLKPGDAAVWAAAIIEVLQEAYGGTRIGRGGVYLPARDTRAERDERIRELMGAPPYTRKRLRECATKLGCSRATVQRALCKA